MKRKTSISIFCGAILIYSLIIIVLSLSEIRQGLAFGEGETMLDKGQYEQALVLFTELINKYPDAEENYYNRARAYIGLKQYEKALLDCDTGIKKSNSVGTIYNYMNLQALIYCKIGNYDKAISICNEAIFTKPENSTAYSVRALNYFNQKEFYNALEDCEKALQIDSSNTMAYKVKGWIHAKAGEIDKNEMLKAVECFTRVIKLEPKDVQTYYNRGLAYQKLGEKDKALADFNRVIQIGTDNDLSQKAREMIEMIHER